VVRRQRLAHHHPGVLLSRVSKATYGSLWCPCVFNAYWVEEVSIQWLYYSSRHLSWCRPYVLLCCYRPDNCSGHVMGKGRTVIILTLERSKRLLCQWTCLPAITALISILAKLIGLDIKYLCPHLLSLVLKTHWEGRPGWPTFFQLVGWP
jgi:hypothetical protein